VTESAAAASPEFFGALPIAAPLASDNDEDGSEMGRCDGWDRSPGFPVSRSRFWCSGWAGSEASGGRLPEEGPSVISRSDSLCDSVASSVGAASVVTLTVVDRTKVEEPVLVGMSGVGMAGICSSSSSSS